MPGRRPAQRGRLRVFLEPPSKPAVYLRRPVGRSLGRSPGNGIDTAASGHLWRCRRPKRGNEIARRAAADTGRSPPAEGPRMLPPSPAGGRQARSPAPGGQIGRAGSRRVQGEGREKRGARRGKGRGTIAHKGKPAADGLSSPSSSHAAMLRTARGGRLRGQGPHFAPHRAACRGRLLPSFGLCWQGDQTSPPSAALDARWGCSPTPAALASWAGGGRISFTELSSVLGELVAVLCQAGANDDGVGAHQLHDREMHRTPDCRIGNA